MAIGKYDDFGITPFHTFDESDKEISPFSPSSSVTGDPRITTGMIVNDESEGPLKVPNSLIPKTIDKNWNQRPETIGDTSDIPTMMRSRRDDMDDLLDMSRSALELGDNDASPMIMGDLVPQGIGIEMGSSPNPIGLDNTPSDIQPISPQVSRSTDTIEQIVKHIHEYQPLPADVPSVMEGADSTANPASVFESPATTVPQASPSTQNVEGYVPESRPMVRRPDMGMSEIESSDSGNAMKIQKMPPIGSVSPLENILSSSPEYRAPSVVPGVESAAMSDAVSPLPLTPTNTTNPEKIVPMSGMDLPTPLSDIENDDTSPISSLTPPVLKRDVTERSSLPDMIYDESEMRTPIPPQSVNVENSPPSTPEIELSDARVPPFAPIAPMESIEKTAIPFEMMEEHEGITTPDITVMNNMASFPPALPEMESGDSTMYVPTILEQRSQEIPDQTAMPEFSSVPRADGSIRTPISEIETGDQNLPLMNEIPITGKDVPSVVSPVIPMIERTVPPMRTPFEQEAYQAPELSEMETGDNTTAPIRLPDVIPPSYRDENIQEGISGLEYEAPSMGDYVEYGDAGRPPVPSVENVRSSRTTEDIGNDHLLMGDETRLPSAFPQPGYKATTDMRTEVQEPQAETAEVPYHEGFVNQDVSKEQPSSGMVVDEDTPQGKAIQTALRRSIPGGVDQDLRQTQKDLVLQIWKQDLEPRINTTIAEVSEEKIRDALGRFTGK